MMEKLGLSAPLDPLAKGGYLECLDFQGPKDTEVSLVLMVQKER